ncbi:MAG: prepilin-type N-terminal cleavage/methylation domain-containing protein [Sphingomonadales bacterium]
MTPHASRQAGFTLLEVLIALSLSALVMTGLFSAASFSQKARDKTVSAADILAEGQALTARLSALIATAQPLRVSDDKGNLVLGFEGTAQSLKFFSFNPGGGLPPGHYHIALETQTPATGVTDLVINLTESGGALAKTTALLLPDIEALEMAYFGSRDGGKAAWRAAWPPGYAAPALIRLSLRAGGREHILHVRPRLLPVDHLSQGPF